MDVRTTDRGWEFWLGASFVVVAVLIIGPAFFLDEWRNTVSSIGAATAAFAVVGASLIAYDGATSKVRLDIAIEGERKQRSRTNLFLKLAFAVDQIAGEGEAVRNALIQVGREHTMFAHHALFLEDLRFSEPPELKEVWDNLEAFPLEVVADLSTLRIHHLRYDRLLGGFEQMSKNPAVFEAEKSRRQSILAETIAQIIQIAKKIRLRIE